jgi:glycosyltransferase involved in cell wall biosynthesis
MAELVERLARDFGCEVHLYAQRVEDLAISDARGESGCGRIVWHKVPAAPGPHLFQFLAWLLLNSALRRWHSFRRASRFDLVLSPGINCFHPDFAIVHALFRRLQELSRDEDASKQVGLVRRMHRRLYYAALAAMERRVYGDPRVSLVAVSSRTAAQLEKYFRRGNVPVVPNGVDAVHFSPTNRLARRTEARRQFGMRDNDIALLLIGNDWRIKGVPLVLEALSAIRDTQLRLLVVGADAAALFKEKARQLGVQDLCQWVAPRKDALEFYACADIYLCPSREDSFGMPVAEAMACGLPVVSSSEAGVSALISDGKDGFVLHDSSDAAALAALIQRLRRNEYLRMQVGSAAAQTASRWTWDNNARTIWQFLQSGERSNS